MLRDISDVDALHGSSHGFFLHQNPKIEKQNI